METSDRAENVRDLEATVDRFTQESDKIGFFDPLLSVVSPPSRHKRMEGGYKIWPEDGPDPAETLRILSYGNSTAVWPLGNWSQQVAEVLTQGGSQITLFHGAGKGSTSSQEVLRVLRDAPQIKPHLIMSLSGICDIGYLLNAPSHPFTHKYTRRVMDFVAATELVSDVVYGYPGQDSPAQVWCRNQRLARVLADEMGFPIVVFLQPVQGFGRYDQTEEERAFFESKQSVVLRAAGKPYGQCVTEFYTEVFEIMAARPQDFDHVVDFTDVFADCPMAYRDHRHQNAKGVAHLAKMMLPVVAARLQAAGHKIQRNSAQSPKISDEIQP